MYLSCSGSKVLFYFVFSLMISVSFGQNNYPDGLLFYLSGENGFTADYSLGNPEVNFNNRTEIMEDGASGKGIHCSSGSVLSYHAPGNIYAERGTLSFFWQSGDSLGKKAFPIFRVGYNDHSSWDMTWLRIDYNGEGFDAFVTDINLARVRVSYKTENIPSPQKWTHFALSWDETKGIRFYIDGKMVAEKDTFDVFYAGLDQFGPHSRIISPYQVQSRYDYIRAGNIDEITIFDSPLDPAGILELSGGKFPNPNSGSIRSLAENVYENEWNLRYGWNRKNDYPPLLGSEITTVRKIEINNIYDHKRWWWKANDGFRETTWPGVYNRSRIPGRKDYFILPDWDCYSVSGKTVRFEMPDEDWNYLEISGGAFGEMYLSEKSDTSEKDGIFYRPEKQERTFHKISGSVKGKDLLFINDVIENPIGEINVFNVKNAPVPEGRNIFSYTITTSRIAAENPCLDELKSYIAGRFMVDERNLAVAMPGDGGRFRDEKSDSKNSLPVVHILIPNDIKDINNRRVNRVFSYTWEGMNAGLDGIELELPAIEFADGIGQASFNLQIKDPLWPDRNMFDFSFSVKKGTGAKIFCDLRDRILPEGKSLYFTIASSDTNFNASYLNGAKVNLVFKSYESAKKEHINDRFLQVKDNYAMIVEERSNNSRLSKYNRLEADMKDLLKVDPGNNPGRNYWYSYNTEQPEPEIELPQPDKNIPEWVFWQIEALKYFKWYVNWYIDNRQIENGELGGGLSDDGDFTNYFPPLSIMGCDEEKVKKSVLSELEACYNNGMFTDGLNTIMTDGLHSYEEGIQVLSQALLTDFGNPKNFERAMETVRSLKERVVLKNKAGHFHFRSNCYSATNAADEGVWQWSTPPQYLMFHPALILAEYYKNPAAIEFIKNAADGLLAHQTVNKDGKIEINLETNFKTDETTENNQLSQYMNRGLFARYNITQSASASYILWAAWRITGDEKYLQPIIDVGPEAVTTITSNMLDIAGLREKWSSELIGMSKEFEESAPLKYFNWFLTGDKNQLTASYKRMLKSAEIYKYLDTEGSLWIDRVYVFERELQRSRMGGVSISRNAIYPGHQISWEFKKPAKALSAGILVSYSTPEEIRMEVYNVENFDIEAEITGWDVTNGDWEITQEIDSGGNLAEVSATEVQFGIMKKIPLKFAPKKSTVIKLKLVKKGSDNNFLPDPAIGKEDVIFSEGKISITVHNLGSADAENIAVEISDKKGNSVVSGKIPRIKSSSDLIPHPVKIELPVPDGINLENCKVAISTGEVNEITLSNNVVNMAK